MKIAVACDRDNISNHFGFCEKFIIYEVDSAEIINQNAVVNPGHRPNFLPEFLASHDIDVLITGGIGVKAARLFSEKRIKTITGITGSPERAVTMFLSGKLQSSGELCHSNTDKYH